MKKKTKKIIKRDIPCKNFHIDGNCMFEVKEPKEVYLFDESSVDIITI